MEEAERWAVSRHVDGPQADASTDGTAQASADAGPQELQTAIKDKFHVELPNNIISNYKSVIKREGRGGKPHEVDDRGPAEGDDGASVPMYLRRFRDRKSGATALEAPVPVQTNPTPNPVASTNE